MIPLYKNGTMMTRRTIMVSELSDLFSYSPHKDISSVEYTRAIIEDNCLSKISMSARKLTAAYLKELYSLDITNPVFSLFRYLWEKDPQSRNMLAIQYVYLNDSIVRNSASFFLACPADSLVTTENTLCWVEKQYGTRFSAVSACSIAKNLNSSWHQAGYLKGVRPRLRVKNSPTVANVVFALYLAFLSNKRGMGLFENEFSSLLELSSEDLFTLTESAARQGYLVFRHLGDVVDVRFPAFEQAEEAK